MQCDADGNVIEEMMRWMLVAGYSAEQIFAMRLSMDEAIVNALKHGNRYDRSKKITVAYEVNGKHVIARVEDQGDGFDPNRVPDPTASENLDRPSGRGLMLMRHFMTSVDYNAQGNAVTLRMNRSHNGATRP